ncbi:MAG: amidase, partial [Actinobacteria bacterium]|nr:amidase [Actinomycetota bacterium]
MPSGFAVVEKTFAELREALKTGEVTSVELVKLYLDRIETYDANGIKLNSIVELNQNAIAEAEKSDKRRASGKTLGTLDG